MACARCGCGVYQTEDIITLNKIWHKCCFTCYRCRKRLDKCTAKIFQGEVFCDRCYKCLLQGLELLSSPSKPCRVASTPSCTCEKGISKPAKVLPALDKSKKYQICFLTNQQVRIVKSCSYIPDKKSNIDKKDRYCLAFPLPREIANYCNRVHTMPKQKQSPTNCCCTENTRYRSKKSDNTPRFAKIRSLSQQPPCLICRENYRSAPPPPQCCKCSRINSPPPGCRCLTPVCTCCPQPPPCHCPPLPPSCRCPPPPPACRCPPQPPDCRCPPPPPACRCPPQPPDCRCPPRPQERYSSLSQERYPPQTEESPPPSLPQCCCASPTPPSPQQEKCCCPQCSPPPRCKIHSPPVKPPLPKTYRSPTTRKPCPPCCPEANRKQETAKKSSCRCCSSLEDSFLPCVCKMPKYCPCGNLNPCNCKMCQVRAICTPICKRCGCKVYAAEKVSVSKGAFHTGCFSCFCCRKPLDVCNFYESCGEIYCKQCYNNLYGNQLYGYGSSQFF
ncbi:keratinocyte proline-rich protein-like [Anoplophora glabripennis]|uniref:keratinocyte proline-rich protein-like n=1 Tax=Anoplophora glabripennis TaxID=217634 RepID=UPI000C76EA43|nr:keratinocyte proline-rich protein-like [Anoplophora glabripennis]